MDYPAVAISAPGKVLFSGGFLVLDRKHTGLVFGLNARIHVHVQAIAHSTSATTSKDPEQFTVIVESPQFRDAKWMYSFDAKNPAQHQALDLSQVIDNDAYTKSRNKFVEVTLQYVLTYLLHVPSDIRQSARITIMADDDYYSQSVAEKTESNHGFTHFGLTLGEVHKTGLGSSAALVTALVSSLLAFYSRNTDLSPKTIHNLAQAAHCAAQGKVGSGFDIAAAVFGSCLYRRFTPAILESIGEPTNPGFGERLHLCVNDLNLEQKWDVEVSSQAVSIPESLLLVMCDVDCGSETPGMVRKVLQWRKEQQVEADLLWNAIQQGSDELCTELRRLSGMDGITMQGHSELTEIIGTIRSFVKEMSRKSGVPIEPDVITELLDYCTSLPGVVGGVAPGAGGYDAVALLMRNDIEVHRDLHARLESWKSKEEATGATIGKVRLLGVKQDKAGIRIEDAGRYGSWTSSDD